MTKEVPLNMNMVLCFTSGHFKSKSQKEVPFKTNIMTMWLERSNRELPQDSIITRFDWNNHEKIKFFNNMKQYN